MSERTKTTRSYALLPSITGGNRGNQLIFQDRGITVGVPLEVRLAKSSNRRLSRAHIQLAHKLVVYTCRPQPNSSRACGGEKQVREVRLTTMEDKTPAPVAAFLSLYRRKTTSSGTRPSVLSRHLRDPSLKSRLATVLVTQANPLKALPEYISRKPALKCMQCLLRCKPASEGFDAGLFCSQVCIHLQLCLPVHALIACTSMNHTQITACGCISRCALSQLAGCAMSSYHAVEHAKRLPYKFLSEDVSQDHRSMNSCREGSVLMLVAHKMLPAGSASFT